MRPESAPPMNPRRRRSPEDIAASISAANVAAAEANGRYEDPALRSLIQNIRGERQRVQPIPVLPFAPRPIVRGTSATRVTIYAVLAAALAAGAVLGDRKFGRPAAQGPAGTPATGPATAPVGTPPKAPKPLTLASLPQASPDDLPIGSILIDSEGREWTKEETAKPGIHPWTKQPIRMSGLWKRKWNAEETANDGYFIGRDDETWVEDHYKRPRAPQPVTIGAILAPGTVVPDQSTVRGLGTLDFYKTGDATYLPMPNGKAPAQAKTDTEIVEECPPMAPPVPQSSATPKMSIIVGPPPTNLAAVINIQTPGVQPVIPPPTPPVVQGPPPPAPTTQPVASPFQQWVQRYMPSSKK